MIVLPDPKILDRIIDNTLETVRESREQIFEIGEQSRQEYMTLERELAEVRTKIAALIEKADETEVRARYARNHLAEVSRAFDRYSTDEVRRAYEQANDYQVQLAIYNQEEIQLRERRDHLERRLRQLEDTVKRAEHLASQMNVVYNFLAKDLKHVGDVIKDAREKQAFGLKIIEAQEEERKRLSREIHDGPAQTLANVLLHSEIIERIYDDRGIEAAMKEFRELRKMVRSSLEEVRRIIYDLRPMALDDLGLIPTLKKYLRTFEERHDILIHFQKFGQERRLPHQFEIAIFRLVQEAVNNAYKHGEATEIKVKIEIATSKVIIVIKDNGKGFDPSIKKEGSFGLVGMRERVNMLHGKIELQSKLNQGTTVYIEIPLEDRDVKNF